MRHIIAAILGAFFFIIASAPYSMERVLLAGFLGGVVAVLLWEAARVRD